MSCVGWDRQLDPKLHDFYARNLLEPGWAGELDKLELAYIKSWLRQSAPLRRRWGFRPSSRMLPAVRIRAVDMYGVGGSKPVLASPGESNRYDTTNNARIAVDAKASSTKSSHLRAFDGKFGRDPGLVSEQQSDTSRKQ